jgi:hypothetical protein
MRLTLPIMSMVITLNPLLKFSAGQWNTLVNIGLALCGLAGQDCIGTNRPSLSRIFPAAAMVNTVGEQPGEQLKK